MTTQLLVERAKQEKNYDLVIQAMPYAKLIGMTCIPIGRSLIFKLPPNEDNIGNPTLPAIHGGVIAGFMEMSATLHAVLTQDTSIPKVVDFSIDYLSPGRLEETFAECQIIRLGTKILNVSVICWQETKKKPVATARVHLLRQ
jgi:acyl-coenzyme A thioesterase PaaI-like protein